MRWSVAPVMLMKRVPQAGMLKTMVSVADVAFAASIACRILQPVVRQGPEVSPVRFTVKVSASALAQTAAKLKAASAGCAYIFATRDRLDIASCMTHLFFKERQPANADLDRRVISAEGV